MKNNITDQSINRQELKNKEKPEWLRVKIPQGELYKKIQNIIKSNNLHTICSSGNCPNISECWNAGTATFMILGDICTRNCKFCLVKTGKPNYYDFNEPKKIAIAIHKMGLKHAVITSVNRDELKDGGAQMWRDTVLEIKKINPLTTIETLIPDMLAKWDSLELIVTAGQEVVSHNIETIPRLYRKICPQGNYERSIEQLKRIKHIYKKRTKSGLIVGLGETDEELYNVMKDLAKINLDILTIGQYLQPTKVNWEVQRYVHPATFQEYKMIGEKLGIKYIESGPLVRSSYKAEKHLI